MKKVFIISVFTSLFFIGCGNDSSQNTETENNTNEVVIEETTETVEINGVNHFIKKMGQGEPIVVLHGGPGMFHDYLVPHFRSLAKNYQIIFYDQRGCGQTDFPKDTTSINIDYYVEDLEGIRNHLKL